MGAPVSESETQSVGDLSPEDQETWGNWWNGLSATDKALLVSNGLLLVPGAGLLAGGVVRGGIAAIKFAPKLLTGIKNLAVKSVTKPGEVVKTATRKNTNQPLGDAAKSMGLTDEASQAVNVAGRKLDAGRAITTSTIAGGGMAGINAIKGTGGEATQQTPVFNEGQTNAVFQIPDDPEKAVQWFANPKNQEFIKQLDQDTVQGVKTLLDDLEIKKKEDLVKAKQDGIMSDANYRAASIMIATASSFDPQVQQSLYNALINEGETGNPSLTRDDLTKTSISAGNLKVARDRLAMEMEDNENIFDDLKQAFTAGIVDGERDFGNADYIAKMKVAGIQMRNKIREGTATTEELEMYDTMIMERMFNEAQRLGSETWKDWFLDWLARRNANPDTIGTGFENIRAKRREDESIESVVFTNLNTRGGRNEAEESMSYADFIRMTGSEEAANNILARAGS
mgnify:FL=1